MATCQEILDQAVHRSNLNDADLIPTTQVLDYITSYERRVFLTAAKENPNFFGKEANTDGRASQAVWTLTSSPGNIAAVTRLEVAVITGTVSGIAVGDVVNLIDIRNPDAELGPRVYMRNRVLFDYNSELETDSSNFVTELKVFYSFLPSDRIALDDNLDLPEEFNNLVVLPLASTLALRDQRPEEAQVLMGEFQLDWGTFLNQVSVIDEGTIRELEQVPAASRRLVEGT